MPIQYPQRQGLNLGAVQLQTSGTAVQAVQGNTQVSPDAAQAAAGKAANAAALSDALASGMTGLVESMRKNYAAQAKFDVTQKQLDDQKADNFIAGDIYRKSAAQSAAFALLGDYSAQREAKLAERATSMPYEQAVAMDRQDLADIQKQLKPHLALMGAEATDALSNQFQQLLAMQSKEAAVKSAEHSIAKASQALDANILGNVPTLMQALNVGDSGAVDQIVQNARTVIDSAEYIPEAQRKQKLQALFLNAGATASSSYELNQLMQAASKHLGMDGVAVMNALEGNRTKASLTERIQTENMLNADTLDMNPEQLRQHYDMINQRIAVGIQEGTYSVEQGSNMQAQAVKLQNKATVNYAIQNAISSNMPLSATSQLTGESSADIYAKHIQTAPVEARIRYAEQSMQNRDAEAVSLASKDLAKVFTNNANLMLSQKDGEFSEEQQQLYTQMQELNRRNPELMQNLLTQAGDSGAKLRRMLRDGEVSASTIQRIRAEDIAAENIKEAGLTPKERTEMAADAGAEALPWLAANGTATFLTRGENWNHEAAQELASEVMGSMKPEELRMGGADLVVQRMQDRGMGVIAYTKQDQFGIPLPDLNHKLYLSTDRGASISGYMQQHGIRNREDLADLVGTYFGGLANQMTDKSELRYPKLMQDGSMQYTIVSEHGEVSYATVDSSEVHSAVQSMYKQRDEQGTEFLKNTAKMRPLRVGNEVVLAQGSDHVVGGQTIPGNWVVEAAQSLLRNEGYRADVYDDGRGNATWGIGFTAASGIKPEQSNTPAKAIQALQGALQTDYGKTVVGYMQNHGVPVTKDTYVLFTEIGFQGPASANKIAAKMGQFIKGTATKEDVLAMMRATKAFEYGGAGRKQERENRLVYTLEKLSANYSQAPSKLAPFK